MYFLHYLYILSLARFFTNSDFPEGPNHNNNISPLQFFFPTDFINKPYQESVLLERDSDCYKIEKLIPIEIGFFRPIHKTLVG